MFVGGYPHAVTLECHALLYDFVKQFDVGLACIKAANVYEIICRERFLGHICYLASQFDIYILKSFQAVDREVRGHDEEAAVFCIPLVQHFLYYLSK